MIFKSHLSELFWLGKELLSSIFAFTRKKKYEYLINHHTNFKFLKYIAFFFFGYHNQQY
jgi:hypothetical protein